MKWVKRGCWITAWSLWAWCGAKLAHQLPRTHAYEPQKPGQIVVSGGAIISKPNGERINLALAKFIRLTVVVVRIRPDESDRNGEVEIWHASVGETQTQVETFAVRDDGGLLFRLWRAPSDPVRAILGDAPPPNYPLLVLCQSVLVLPLIFLWALLRWRRRRRLQTPH